MHLLNRFKHNSQFPHFNRVLLLPAMVFSLFQFVSADFLNNAVYSRQDMYLGPRVTVNNGTLQSDTYILIDAQSNVTGDILSGGNALIRSGTSVTGNVFSNGTVSLESGVQINGSVSERTTVTPQTIPLRSVTIGTANVTVNGGYSQTINPGKYNTITVNSGGKLVLKKGLYQCKSFVTYFDAKIHIDAGYSDFIELRVRDNLTMYDRTKMTFAADHDPSAIEIYAHQTTMVDIGPESNLTGYIFAPRAHVRVRDRASINGAVIADKVSILAESTIRGIYSVDSDGDLVPDYIEIMAHSNRFDALDKPVVVTGQWANKTGMQSQRVLLDYSHYSGYSTCDSIPMEYRANSLASPNIMIEQLLPADELPMYPLPPGIYAADTLYQQICCSTIRSGYSVEHPFAISNTMQHFPASGLKLYHYNESTTFWDEVPISRIEPKAVYGEIKESGYYVIGAYMNTLFVDPSITSPVHPNYNDLAPAVNWLLAQHITNGSAPNRYLIAVAAGSYTCNGLFVPANTRIEAGYTQGFLRNTPDSKVYKTYIVPGSTTKAALIVGNRNYFYTDAANCYTDFDSSVVDGFIFDGSSNTGVVSAPAGAVQISGAWHVRNIHFKNCVFTKNRGTMAGAVFANNASLIFFDNCVFTENTSIGGGVFTDPVCNPNTCRTDIIPANWSGGAVSIFEFDLCGVEAEFHGCAFYKNSTTWSNYSGALSKLGATVSVYGGAGAGRPVKIVNSTFTQNTITGAATGSGRSVYRGDYETMTGAPVVLINSIFYGNTGVTNEIAGVTETNVTYKTNVRTVYGTLPPAATDYTVPAVSFCAIEGWAGTTNGNISADPIFEDPSATKVLGKDGNWLTPDDGLNVKLTSPLRKRAKSDCLPEQMATTETDYYRGKFFDAAGRERMGYEVSASTYRTDIGAYEKYVKIMCMGDDNTVGYNPDSRGETQYNYRKLLAQKLRDSKIEFDFVGSVNSGDALDIQHEGYAGYKIEDYYAPSFGLADKISNEKPDYIVLMVGSNNILNGELAANVFGKLYHATNTSLVTEILKSLKADGKLLVSYIPPVFSGDVIDPDYSTFNNNIKSITVPRVSYIDIDPGITLVSNKCIFESFKLNEKGFIQISPEINNSIKSIY